MRLQVEVLLGRRCLQIRHLGDSLDLVENDPGALGDRRDFSAQERRILLVLERGCRREEVDRLGIRELGPEPGALAGTARPEEEKRS